MRVISIGLKRAWVDAKKIAAVKKLIPEKRWCQVC